MTSTLSALLLALVVVAARAAGTQETPSGFVWEQTTIALETDGSREAKDVIFRFRNEGTSPVVIRSVNTSCGCTVGTPDKTEYGPGEIGSLPVKHKPRPGPGTRSYRINVRTDEGGGREHLLTLQVTHNPRLTIQPRVINWAKDEPRTPKNVDIRIRPGEALKVTGASAQPEVLDIAVNDGPDPDSQTLVIAPKPGTALVPGRVRVQLTTEPPLPPSMDTQFFAVLR